MEKLKTNWTDFKAALEAQPDLDLQFQYDDGKFVDASYHITEVKQAPITSVDCGGVMNAWTEVIVQLYEPENRQQLKPMKVKKALSIFNLVESKLSLNPLAVVKVEFGNSAYEARQMHPNSITQIGDDLIIDLRPDTVQCKAIDRDGNCGIPAEKQKIELVSLSGNTCTPGGGCC
ncbi:hypothetical protein EOD41_13315 [Mucilaginibacter limnophilus]|uniref:Uncharacterized protein n=1 Tax=Mucilaginibacter limnophilus TaxID=1932778 RepID=A0A437MS31_9SPHI|nr:DUF6428 family protein [Mucilaginibacter limnophilus]RVU00450.1 hypothetical protein EOD41_13315 [Mucilaginibacter limnophilus]